MVLGAHLPAPDFHNSPKHREPFSSVFTSSMTKMIGQNTPGRKDFQQLLLQAAVIASRWRLGTLVFTREAVSKLNEMSRWGRQTPATGQTCTQPLLLLGENLMGKLVLLQTVVLAQEGPVDPCFQPLHPAFWVVFLFKDCSFKKHFYLFLYFGCAVFHCCMQAFSSCERWLPSVVVPRLLIAVASLVAEHRL